MLRELVLFGLTGAFCWSFAEYAIHNWVGHLGRGRNEFSREHLEHHRLGDYFAPTSKKAKAALPVLAALAAVLVPLLGGRPGGGFVLGFGLAYLAYEVLHRRLHTHPPRGPYGRWARRHHFYHHFMSPKRNHGVTSPLWDLVFGTYARPGVVRVPRRKAMRWLRPDEAAHARDYEVVGESPR